MSVFLAQLTAGAESWFISGKGNSAEYLMIAVLKEFFFPFNLQGFPYSPLVLCCSQQIHNCCSCFKQLLC